MAKKPIEIYILETDEADYVGGPELFTAYGVEAADIPGIKKHVVTLKPRFSQAMQEDVERAVQVIDPQTGQVKTDELKRAGAMIAEYVEGWDFTDDKGAIPCDAEGYKRLEPLIAAEVRNRVMARVFPLLSACPDFFSAVVSAQQGKLSGPKSSETAESNPAASPVA